MRILHESNKQWLVWSRTSSKVWKEFKLKMEIPCQARYSECGTGTNSGLFSGRRMEHSEQPKQRVHQLDLPTSGDTIYDAGSRSILWTKYALLFGVL